MDIRRPGHGQRPPASRGPHDAFDRVVGHLIHTLGVPGELIHAIGDKLAPLRDQIVTMEEERKAA